MSGSDSNSDFQGRPNRSNKRKRKQKGKGVGPAQKRKVVPVKNKHSFNRLRKKEGVKNKAKRTNLEPRSRKLRKPVPFLKLLRCEQHKKLRDSN